MKSEIKHPELWKRIEAVYPGKSEEYKKEVYDLLCPEYKIKMRESVIASMEKMQSIALPLAFYGKDLKKRAKERSAKGGSVPKKDPGLMFAIEYAWVHSKEKTCLALWSFLKKACKGDFFPLKEKADLVFEDRENKLYHYHPDGKARGIGFRAFQKYVADFKKQKSL
jgi:hypothetical protein